jgi:hypothetical protein
MHVASNGWSARLYWLIRQRVPVATAGALLGLAGGEHVCTADARAGALSSEH